MSKPAIVFTLFFAVFAFAPSFLREPLYVLGKVDGDCDTKNLSDAREAEQEAQLALINRKFGFIENVFAHPSDAEVAFKEGRLRCDVFRGGYDPFLSGRYWQVSCFDVPRRECGPIVDVGFRLGYCGTISNILRMSEYKKCQ